VLERAQPLGLALESRDGIGIVEPAARQHLHHHLARWIVAHRSRACEIHVAHTAAPDQTLERVAACDDTAW
jgi:hypothetical protein